MSTDSSHFDPKQEILTDVIRELQQAKEYVENGDNAFAIPKIKMAISMIKGVIFAG